MKKLIFPAVAALALGLASCSSDEVNPGNGGGTVNYAEGGYVRLSINMPSTKGTRGVNDNFDDGLAREYAVKNAQLILFSEDPTSSGEANANFHSAYELTAKMGMYDDNPNQITSMTKIVKKVNDTAKPATGKHLYALVVLNNNGITTVNSDNTLNVNGTAFIGNFKKFLELTSTTATATPQFSQNVENNGIFMTNAPLADKQGGSADPGSSVAIHTLTDVTNSIYKTQNEAQNAPAADIFVERAVAKVTLSKESSSGAGKGELTGQEFSDNKVSWEIIGWDLDITNKKSFLVRNVDFTPAPWQLASNDAGVTDKWRFIGKEIISAQKVEDPTPAPSAKDLLYRTYWAKDPNYAVTTGTDYVANGTKREFYDLTGYASLKKEFGNAYPRYCYENTFNVVNQNQGQTTRAIVAVQLKLGDLTTTASSTPVDLYTFNTDRSKLYKKEDMEKRVKAAVLNKAQADIMKNYKPATSSDKVGADDVTVTFAEDNADLGTEKLTVAKISKAQAAGNPDYIYNLTDAEIAAVNTEVGTIEKYQNGIAYYPIRIKHFGDETTPWNASEIVKPTAGNIYPTLNAEANYLGRYGVVRNNWYDIAVKSISGVGSATVPAVYGKFTPKPGDTDTPDDELYNYISVRINILSWAKRTQHEDL